MRQTVVFLLLVLCVVLCERHGGFSPSLGSLEEPSIDDKQVSALIQSFSPSGAAKDADTALVPSLGVTIIPSYVSDTDMVVEVDTSAPLTFTDYPEDGTNTVLTLPAAGALDLSVQFYEQIVSDPALSDPVPFTYDAVHGSFHGPLPSGLVQYNMTCVVTIKDCAVSVVDVASGTSTDSVSDISVDAVTYVYTSEAPVSHITHL
ncbi:hypothetical protein KIPB_012460, partial [Kipferlia bialata]|eukprot:g12460.t1